MIAASRCSASDLAALVGTPWARGADGPEAYDCWAFAAMVQATRFGRLLPRLRAQPMPMAYDIAAVRRAWAVAERPREGDLVELMRFGQAAHVGVWLEADGGGVLHCQEGAGVVFDRLDVIRLMGWRPRFWTPVDTAARRRRRQPGPRAVYLTGIDGLLAPGETDAERLIAAHRGIALEVRAGDTVAGVLARAGLGHAAVVCFVQDRDAGPPELDLEAAAAGGAGLKAALEAVGAVERERWAERRLGRHERLVVQHLPEGGGGGSNPLRIVLSIVVIAAAVAAAAVFGPTLATALGVSQTLATSAIFGTVSLLGNLAISALLPPPSPRGLRDGLSDDRSPTFSAAAQSSVARPGAPIPVQLGRHIHLVDDAAPPWSTFVANKQRLHQLLALGEGEHLLEEVRVGDVTIWRDGSTTGNLPGVEIEQVAPFAPVTLFDDQVFTQGDVSGLALDPLQLVGWHNASPTGVTVIALEVDIGFQQLVFIDAQGNDQLVSVDVLVEAQVIGPDDQGQGEIFTLEQLTFSAATRDPLRSSHRWLVPEARYRVRMKRLTAAGDSNTFDDAFWTGLKGVLRGGRTYGDVGLLAVRVEVGPEIAAQSARRVSVVKTRKLPVWDGQAWSAPTPTREIAWAVAEILRRHGRLGDIDLDELLALHETWIGRGDTFDTVFDQQMSLWEGLQAALRAGRAQPDQLGSRIRFWRDEPRDLPRQLFSERNIRRGSLSIRPVLPVTVRPERLIAQFMNEETWRIDEIAVGPAGERERRERYFGIVNRAQLTRELAHDWRAARFRSIRLSFEVELENRLIRRGDPIAVAHRQLTTSVAVALEDWRNLAILFDREIDWAAMGAEPRLALTAPDGSVWGPLKVSGSTDGSPTRTALADLDDFDDLFAQTGLDPRDFVPRSSARDEAIRGVIGPTAEIFLRAIVESVGPERRGLATITAVDDDPAAHDLDVVPSSELDDAITALNASLTTQGADTVAEVSLSIAPAFAAAGLNFVHEVSTDGAVSFLPAAQGPETQLSFVVPSSTTHLRAAAVGATRGPWGVVAVSTLSATAPANLAETTPGLYALEAVIDVAADPVAGAVGYEFMLREAGSLTLAAIVSRPGPALRLIPAELVPFGGPWRDLTVELRAVGGAGERSATVMLALANSAPAAPTGLRQDSNTFTWDAAPEADVSRWRVKKSWQSAAFETATRSTAWSDGQSGTITVWALDAIGAGPGASLSRSFSTNPDFRFGGGKTG